MTTRLILSTLILLILGTHALGQVSGERYVEPGGMFSYTVPTPVRSDTQCRCVMTIAAVLKAATPTSASGPRTFCRCSRVRR
jgi:hypothetical protein